MSFPPRPPMGMPPMMPGAYYTPMVPGMVPMGMRMMTPPMIRPVVNSAQPKQAKKLIPQEIPKNEKEDKPPVTTVFVGNISDKAPDVMIKQMLQRCGNVLSWKRVQGASGKLQAFGFCEYEDPEATLRCIRLLNDWFIPDKKLVVKVDAKTKTLLDEYRSKKKAAETSAEDKKEKEKKEEENGDKENGEIRDDESSADELDEFTKREDRVATAGLEAIMMEYTDEMSKAVSTPEEKKPPKVQIIKEGKDVKDVGLDGLEVEEETKYIINREIRSFRDLHKDEEVDEEKEKREAERRNEEMRRRREREREKMREKEKSRHEERMEKRREDRRSRTRSRSRTPSRGRSYRRDRDRERDRERERDRDRERERERTRSPERSRRKEQEIEDEEEAKERRKLEKKLREKEAAYKERLTNWEARERKKSRENEKEREREEERKIEETREGRRLKEFLEDYDDLRDDPKFFKGSAMARRLKEREKEKEADARDRQREKEEFEEIKRRLMNEGHPDPEAELARIEREREEHLKPRLQIQEIVVSPSNSITIEKVESSDSQEKPAKMQNTLKPVDAAPVVTNTVSPMSDDDDDDNTMFSLNNEDLSQDSQPLTHGPSTKAESSKLGFSSIKLGSGSTNSPDQSSQSSKRKKLTVGDVFNQDDDSSESKKRKLIPLDYDEEKKPNSAEEKRNKIKILIDSIPTAKEELFAFSLDWTIVDQPLMDKRIKPWINKKIVEYIGEEEPTLTDFICQKVIARSTPASIQNDVAMVLDEEAEVFVVKMWRLLVYETEAKKLGLVK